MYINMIENVDREMIENLVVEAFTYDYKTLIYIYIR